MIYIIIIFFCLWGLKSIVSNRPFTLIYLIYALSFICVILYDIFIPQNIQTIPVLYLFIVLLLWFTPFNNLCLDYKSLLYNEQKLLRLAKFLGIALLLSAVLCAYKLYYVVSTYGFQVEVRVMSNDRESFIPYFGIIDGFFSKLNALYFIAIFLFFVGLVFKWKKSVLLMLLIGSFSLPLGTLVQFGRDGVVYFMFSMILSFFIVKPCMDKKLSRKILILIGSSLVGVLLILMIISLARFQNEHSSDNYIIVGTLGYIGQQVGNFCDIFYVDCEYAGTMFPSFYAYWDKFFGITNRIGYDDVLIKNGLESETFNFGFYVKNLLGAYGIWGTLIFSCFLNRFFCYLKKKYTISNHLYYFMLLLVFFQVPLQGVFYYRQGVGSQDLIYFIFILFLYLFFKRKIVFHQK